MKNLAKEFKEFIATGSMIQLAAPSGPSEVDLLTEIRDSLKARG